MLFMVLREDKMGQSFLLPLNLKEVIPKDHICFFITDLVNELDFEDIEKKYQYNPGKSAYSRRMLMRIIIMASVDGVFSSRKIMKLINENMIYMYLSGLESPDFRTIGRFKIEAQKLIEEAFKATVLTSKKLKLLKLEHIAIDGTKFKANASDDNNLTEKEIKAIKKIIQKGIDVDKKEDELYGDKEDNNESKVPITREKRKKLIREILKDSPHAKQNNKRKRIKKAAINILNQALENPLRTLEKLENAENELKNSKQKSVSLTDPDSRWMKNKKNKKELSYNSQISVDHKSGIIITNSVTQDPTDHHQLIPQIEKIIETIGPLPANTSISADNGYFTQDNIAYIYENELDAYIPNRKQATEAKTQIISKKPFSKHNFQYDHENNLYICPNNKKLPYQKTYKYEGKIRQQYYSNECLKCPDQTICTGKNRMKIITDYGGDLAKKMSLKMETSKAKSEFAKRKETVEHPFGNVKQNLKFTEYYSRGLKQIKTENNLIYISHNIKRIFNEITKKTKETTPKNTTTFV